MAGSETDTTQTREIIAQTARAHERDHYLSALLSPSKHRAALIALTAFVGDVSRIPIFVSEPMIGEIRLQWWRDGLKAGVDGKQSGNPILDAMSGVLREHGVPLALALGIVDAQSLCLFDDPPRDEMELRQHLAKLHGGAFTIAARIVDAEAAREDAEWIRDAGIAYGIARIAMELPAIEAQGRTLVPATWTDEPGIKTVNRRRLTETASSLHTNLTRRPLRPSRAARQAARPLAMVPPYCAFVNARIDESHTTTDDVSPLRRAWTLWRGVK